MPTGSNLMASSNTTPRRRSKSSSRRKANAQKKQSARPQIHLTEGKLFERRISPFIYLARLMIVILGSSTIIGTSLSVISPPRQTSIPRPTASELVTQRPDKK